MGDHRSMVDRFGLVVHGFGGGGKIDYSVTVSIISGESRLTGSIEGEKHRIRFE